MDKRYYLAADGGGSKLLAVLYDEDFNIVSSGEMKGTNDMFRPAEMIRAEMNELTEKLIPSEVRKIEMFDCSVVGDVRPFLAALGERCAVGPMKSHSEGDVALAAGGVLRGVVAQAGTGSDAFLVQREKRSVVGGWGMTLGDEGSGYYIGLNTLRYSIWAEDGRGQPSVLPQLIKEAWGLKELREIITRVAGNPDMRTVVAGVTRITSKAAVMGDALAVSILEEAGHQLAVQVLTVLRQVDGRFEGPIIASGGAWKASYCMFEAMRREVAAVYPDAEIRFPDFEPLIGSVILQTLRETGREEIGREQMKILHEKFAAYRYQLPPDFPQA